MANLKRQHSLFQGSRLYRQSKDGSDILLNRVSATRNWFDSSIREIADGISELNIDSAEAADIYINKLEQSFISEACNLLPYYVIPILVESATRFYYEIDRDILPTWFGLAVKSCISAAWPSVFEFNPEGNTCSFNIIESVVYKAALLQQLNSVRYCFELVPDGKVKIISCGIIPDPEFRLALNSFRNITHMRGKILRLTSATIEGIHLRPEQAIEGIKKVLQGTKPCEVNELRDSIFGDISDDNPEFWAGILARIYILQVSRETRSRVIDNPHGVSIIGKPLININGLQNPCLIQSALSQCFWQESWYKKRDSELWSALIVERPVIRLDSNQELYVTSSALIRDSINSFIEASVMRYQNMGNVMLSQNNFRHLVSEPFEKEVQLIFHKYQFKVGSVNDSGSWNVHDGPISLKAIAGDTPPGEIDVLAVHENGYVIICECKVLALPMKFSQFRNLVQKIGSQDVDSFHSKLIRKKRWINSIGNFLTPKYAGIMAFLVVDRQWPGGVSNSEIQTIEHKMLEHILGEFLSENHSI